MSLHQAFAHCAIFPAAASRRSLDRVSVPVWLIVLSDQLPVFGLVSRYLTNYLIGRETIPQQRTVSSTDHAVRGEYPVLIQVSLGYPGLGGRFLTCYAPVRRCPQSNLTERLLLARLACIKRTANVRPEPGSNSPSKFSMRTDPVSVCRTQTRSVFHPSKGCGHAGRLPCTTVDHTRTGPLCVWPLACTSVVPSGTRGEPHVAVGLTDT